MNIIGITGWKNCGKTTLSTRLISELTRRGYRVSSIKHAHHAVDVDQPNTDSYRHREAGAGEVILAGGSRIAIMQELRGADEPTLDQLIARLSPCDWVVVEGYKREAHRKIEVHRAECPHPPRCHEDDSIVAIASDHAVEFAGPRFDINDITAITDFILQDCP